MIEAVKLLALLSLEARQQLILALHESFLEGYRAGRNEREQT